MKSETHAAVRLSDLLDPDMLQGIGSAFARLTGLAMSVRDEDGRLIAEQAGESTFCRMTMSSSSGRAACDRSHGEAVEFACMTSAPCTHHCHAGLAQVAVPIVLEDRVVGAIFVGDRPVESPAPARIRDLAQRHAIDAEALMGAARSLTLWPEGEIAAATAFAGRLAELIGLACFESLQLRRRVDELAAIHDVASMLAGRSELREVLDISANRLREVMGVRATGIRLLKKDTGELRIAAVANLSPAYLNKGPLRVSQNPIDAEALAGHTVQISDIQNDPRTVYKEDARREGLVSGLVAPLSCRGQTIGVIRAYTDRPHRFGPFDVALMQAMASQIAAAIVNSRLYRETREAERLERQVKLAGEVQRRMIPSMVPDAPRYDFGCVYEPNSNLCGDFYDFLSFPNGDTGVVIADVVGKGIPASLMMASARATLRSLARKLNGVHEVMAAVNRRLCHDTLESEFVTAFYGVLSADGSRLTYCNAGHEPLLFLRNGSLRSLDAGGMLLGVDEDAHFEPSVQEIMPGDVLVLITDGLIDALNFDDESYGRRRLRESICRHGNLPADLLAKQLLWDVRRFSGLAPPPDDITLVVTCVREPLD
ncbi:MAG: SpoIIE family protein phosphatase [Phycisphaerae bacterium]